MADDRDAGGRAGSGPAPDGGVSDDGPDDDDGEWRFGLDDVDEDGIVETERERSPIEPESVSIENAVFVAIGALGTVLVFLSATL